MSAQEANPPPPAPFPDADEADEEAYLAMLGAEALAAMQAAMPIKEVHLFIPWTALLAANLTSVCRRSH